MPTCEHDAATHALVLAHAGRAKTAGVTPESPDIAPMVRTRSTTLGEEAAELLTLAKWWTPAYAATEQFTMPAPEVKARSSV